MRRHASPEHADAIVSAVSAECEKQHLDPALMAGLIWHESRFSPSARSRTNDHGLCQLHASTFGGAIYDIRENVAKGTTYLAGCIAAEGGDVARGLARYNGGPRGPRYGQCRRYAAAVLQAAEEARQANHCPPLEEVAR